MALIQVNWLYFEMAGTFNAIERSVRIYEENQKSMRERMITDISKQIRSSQTLINPKEALRAEMQIVDYHFTNTYPQIQAYSALTLAYSAVEYWIDRLCERVRSDRNLPVGLRDFNGTLTERFAKFTKTFSLDDMRNRDRSLIEKIRLLRNCIVHAYGRIADSQASAKLIRIVKQEKRIDTNENGALSITIDKAIELVDSAGNAVASVFKSWNLGPSIKIDN